MATRILAYFGARVIKIEGPRKLDSWRGNHRGLTVDHFPNLEPGERPYDRNAWFNTQNHDKLSVGIDLKVTGAREVVLRIARICDLVVANFSPGTLDRLGLGYADLMAVRPDVIVVEMPALGNDGPYGQHVGMGQSMEAASGMTSLMGYGDGIPTLTGYAYLDPIGGLNGAAAAMTAIEYRRVTGIGQYVEVPQVEAAMHFIAGELEAAFAGEDVVGGSGNDREGELIHDVYPCRGHDEWVAIACSDSAELGPVLRALQDEREDDGAAWDGIRTGADPRLGPWRDRVSACTAEMSKDEVARRLQASGVRAAPVYNGRDLASDPHMWAQDFFAELSHPDCGTHYYPGLPYGFSMSRCRMTSPAPCFGEHNRYVLKELLRMSEEEIAGLESTGVLASEAVLDAVP
jgi:crotonobetainyl-CoA:carnitine CoA-transferase CaiB-like acyl-CoA transferase